MLILRHQKDRNLDNTELEERPPSILISSDVSVKNLVLDLECVKYAPASWNDLLKYTVLLILITEYMQTAAYLRVLTCSLSLIYQDYFRTIYKFYTPPDLT